MLPHRHTSSIMCMSCVSVAFFDSAGVRLAIEGDTKDVTVPSDPGCYLRTNGWTRNRIIGALILAA